MTNEHFKLGMPILFSRSKMNALATWTDSSWWSLRQFPHFLTTNKFLMHMSWPNKLILLWCSDSVFCLYIDLIWPWNKIVSIETTAGEYTHRCQPARSTSHMVVTTHGRVKSAFELEVTFQGPDCMCHMHSSTSPNVWVVPSCAQTSFGTPQKENCTLSFKSLMKRTMT